MDFFKNKVDKILTRLAKIKRTQTNESKNENKIDIATYITEIQRLIWVQCEQLNANKLENLEKWINFEKQPPTKTVLTRRSVIRSLPTKERPELDGFISKTINYLEKIIYQLFREDC